MSTNSAKITRLTQLALLSAILFIMGFTPLGSIPLGGPIVATLAQIPVVIGAILMGTGAGAFLGAVFGFVSFLWFTMYAPPTAFVFSPFYSVNLADGNVPKAIWFAVCSLIICFVPRILIGVVSSKLYQKLYAKTGSVSKAAAVAGVCGSLINTLLVLLGILVFFAAPYAEANGNQVIWAILGTSIVVNGIPEAIVTPLITVAVVKPMTLVKKRGK
ncbi:ECF transporter S component [Hydrogenoanaerobacterium sp.]|uniref:ECF transporter S component n=1 Tax=Hydrogenoanaerobacterium sp. TaxID=2953763 RepID=UPI00289DD775|nr:ECF transporter S component [Hydrogenoanaerobacterium sp.]